MYYVLLAACVTLLIAWVLFTLWLGVKNEDPKRAGEIMVSGIRFMILAAQAIFWVLLCVLVASGDLRILFTMGFNR